MMALDTDRLLLISIFSVLPPGFDFENGGPLPLEYDLEQEGRPSVFDYVTNEMEFRDKLKAVLDADPVFVRRMFNSECMVRMWISGCWLPEGHIKIAKSHFVALIEDIRTVLHTTLDSDEL